VYLQKARGFSLIELMVVLVITAVLINAALPSFNTLISTQERSVALNDLVGAFALARQHAVMNAVIVTVCPLDASNNCGRDWNGNIHAFLDPENTRKRMPTQVLLRTIAPGGRGRLIVRSLRRSFFQFKPTGLIHSDLGNITWCPYSADPSLAGQIIISRGGRLRIAQDSDDDGIPEDAQGRPIRC